MELHLSRDEIVRQVRAHMGEQTNNALGSATSEQTIVAVQAAALKVQQDCRWVNAIAEVTVTLGTAQNRLNYPEGGGPGSINEIGVFDEGSGDPPGKGKYYRVIERAIQVIAAQDQQQEAGGDVFTDVQDRPRYYQQRDQILLWPYSNKEYKVRIQYQRQFTLPLGSSVCIVDGQLIIYWAASMLSMQRENPEMAAYMARQYQDRLGQLKGWQGSGSTFAMDSEADLGEQELFNDENIPRWDRNPTIRT